MHDLVKIQVVGSRSDWFVLGLDKYGTVWSRTPSVGTVHPLSYSAVVRGGLPAGRGAMAEATNEHGRLANDKRGA